MDKIIYLEPDEELTSVLDKLKKTEEKSIILVVPKDSTLSQSLVNLKLLSKKAIDLGKEIALVTADKIGRNLASQAGLTVYSRLDEKTKIIPERPKLPMPPGVVVKTYAPSLGPESMKEAEPPSEPPSISPKTLSKKPFKFPPISFGFWTVLLISFLLVFLVLYLILSKATISLVLKTEPFSTSLQILVDQKTKEIDYEKNFIPGKVMELEKEGTKKFASTGQKNVGGKAKGTMIISNSFKNPDGSGKEIGLKEGTRFKDKRSGKIFVSTTSVTVFKLTYDPNTGREKPGQANVEVEAEEPGESSNISPSSFYILSEGVSSLSAESSENFTGGYDKFVKVVSQNDLEKAAEELSKDLFDKAKKELKEKLEKGYKLLEGGTKDEILETSGNVKAETQTSEFEMKSKVLVSTLVVKESDYKSLLANFLEKSVPPNKKIVSTKEDVTSLSLLFYDKDTKTMTIKAEMTTKIAPKIDGERLKEDLAKKTKEKAKEYLNNLSEIESFEIKLWPLWSKKLPTSGRIKIKTKP